MMTTNEAFVCACSSLHLSAPSGDQYIEQGKARGLLHFFEAHMPHNPPTSKAHALQKNGLSFLLAHL